MIGVYIDISEGGGLENARMCLLRQIIGTERVVMEPIGHGADECIVALTKTNATNLVAMVRAVTSGRRERIA